MSSNKKVWQYFAITLFISYLPAICRFFVSLGSEISWYDTKDTLFASLALLLSNFTLVGDDETVSSRMGILFGSLALMFPIITMSIVLMINEKNPNYHESASLITGNLIFAIVSGFVSFSANNNVYQSV